MIDLKCVIGIYGLTNTGSILIHQIDYDGDRVLASLNGSQPEWCPMTEQYVEESGELESGFTWGELFVPFADVLRFYGGCE